MSPEFFQQGGFANYDIRANRDGLRITDGVQLHLQQHNRQLSLNDLNALTSSNPLSSTSTVVLPDFQRNPTNLTLTSVGLLAQNFAAPLTLGQGAAIHTDPLATVKLNSDTSIFVNGTIDAPAGNIALTITPPSSSADLGFSAAQGIWMGAGSRLLAQGVFQAQPSANGLNTGNVLPGGTVSLIANRGYIVGQRQSTLDVSGTSATLDFWQPASNGSGPQLAHTSVPSAGGSINLTAAEGIIADGTLQAHAGGAGVAGGALAVELNRLNTNKASPEERGGKTPFPDDLNPDQPQAIIVSASSAATLADGFKQGSELSTADFNGKAWLSSPNLNAAGFSAIGLKTEGFNLGTQHYQSSIVFKGDVSLQADRQIVLDSPSMAWSPLTASDKGIVDLVTSYAALGSTRSRIDLDLGSGNFSTQLAPEAHTGTARFNVHAAGIDLVGGLSFDGYKQVNLDSSGDVRTKGIGGVGAQRDYRGELNVAGNLNIRADQVYPATLTDYRINVSGNRQQGITITSTGEPAAPVYSAGGSLTINAPNIWQHGVVKAPFGSLALNATYAVDLSAGSLTSVSGAGVTVPFGHGSAGQNWLYPLNTQGSTNLVINTPPPKSIVLNGRTVNLPAGATVDLSGGGDLYAYEFIEGPGGSTDVLDSSSAGYVSRYAVIPGVHNILTPYDPLEFASSGLQVGDSVYLSGGNGLAAGVYTLLPAHYALLPGAYLVTPRSGTQDMPSGQSFTDTSGITVVSGHYAVADTNIANARWQGFAVEAGSKARNYSEYRDYSANTFFANQATAKGTAVPQLPRDGGSLALEAATSLSLGAVLNGTPAQGGLGGQVDITGNRLEVVGRREDLADVASGTLGLLAEDLNTLNAPSLLLGGLRSGETLGQRLTVSAQSVEVAGDVTLKGQDILLAAKDTVTVKSGATLTSTGKNSVASPNLLIANADGNNSDGALLRVSASAQANTSRDHTVTANTGTLIVESGAKLQAQGSMLLDSTQDTRFAGDIALQGGSLALNSSKISLGAAPAHTSGLVLHNTSFDLDELRLTSASDVNLFGAVDLHVNHLSIATAAINGFNNSGKTSTLSGDTITLSNPNAAHAATGTGTGQLNLNAREIQLGAGDYAIGGFNHVTMNATGAILGQGRTTNLLTGQGVAAGTGHLHVNSDFSLNAARIGGEAGATTVVDASGHQVTMTASTNDKLTAASLGASWTLTADSIQGNAHFDLPSGLLTLQALKGDVALASGTTINVAGRSQSFSGQTESSPAGQIWLKADDGNVVLAPGAELNLGATFITDASGNKQQASNAGLLGIVAPHGQFDWNGTIDAHGAGKANPAFLQGRLRMDVASLGAGGFSALNNKLGTAGFTEEVTLEQRLGNITIANGDTVQAHQFQLSADQGAVTIAGKIDATGQQGGSVSIYGRNGIRLDATGQIDASATAKNGAGGSVLLDTVHRDDTGSGLLDLSAASGSIKVSAGAGGVGGNIHLRTGRQGDSVAATAINAQLLGAAPGRIALEATQIYTGVSNITAADIATWQADTANYMSSAVRPANTNITLMPGIEIRSNGDLTLADKWDFMDGSWVADPTDETGTRGQWESTWRYADTAGSNTIPGFLTLRAGNDLNINAPLTDGVVTSPLPGVLSLLRFQNALQPGQSWSYNLVAGNNINLAPSYTGLSPTDPTSGATQDGLQVVVRTGTGDINVQAGDNIHFINNPDDPHAAAAIYTMGHAADYTVQDLLSGRIPNVPAPNPGESQVDYLSRLDPAQMNTLLRYGFQNLSFDDIALPGSRFLAEHPTDGGAIHLTAGGNIDGIQTGQLITDWLVREGAWNGDPSTQTPTARGINISGDFRDEGAIGGADGNIIFTQANRNFNQNVGALGGGNVTVQAGGNVNNLSVMIPTTGKTFGTWNEDHQWVSNNTVINGGGNLSVAAGGDIVGGEYFTGHGTARLDAGGNVKTSDSGVGTILELGNAIFNVHARGDLNLGSVLNPTVLPQTIIADPMISSDAFFFTYNPASSVALSSSGGNVILQNDVNAIRTDRGLDTNAGSGFEFAVYPGNLQAAAASGDIRINNSFSLFPSATGNLQLFAGGNIGTDVQGRQITINVSDTDPVLLPSMTNPAQGLYGSIADSIFLAQERLDPTTYVSNVTHAATPVQQGNFVTSNIVALGDIAFPSTTPVSWYFPNTASFHAGRDIRNLSVLGQNLTAFDASIIQAGRDILYDSPIDENGSVLSIDRKILWGGPGHLEVVAGRNINLGSSSGIQTVGNLSNSALPSTGANVSVLAGLSDKIDFSGFLDHYFSTNGTYAASLDHLTITRSNGRLLFGFDVDNTNTTGTVLNLSRAEKLALLKTLTTEYILPLMESFLFEEIRLAAEAAALESSAAKKEALYARGFDAIRALFPGEHYQGDLSLVFSQIKTLAGGNINLLVPGGKVDVGLAGKNGGIAKTADQLGIVAQQAGNVNAFSSGDFNVNQSRVFTMLGGDIVLWSSNGSIDAGKGAKGAISAPPPITTIDNNGNLVTTFPPVVSGSGIQAVSPEDKNKRQGNVYLAAPNGVVDAGEAGIAGGHVVVAASAVIGASNIQASNGTAGVPSTVAAPVVVPGADAAAAGVAKTAAQQATDNATNSSKPAPIDEKALKSALSSIQADVLGFGDCSVSDVREGKAGCGG